MPRPIDIEAEIYWLESSEGGRKSAAFSGYRPQFFYNDNDWVVSLAFPEVENAMPGQTTKTHVAFMSPAEHFGQIHEGMQFKIREGSRTVGKGTVSKIIELPNSAAKANARAT